jgi:hypothetical protein
MRPVKGAQGVVETTVMIGATELAPGLSELKGALKGPAGASAKQIEKEGVKLLEKEGVKQLEKEGTRQLEKKAAEQVAQRVIEVPPKAPGANAVPGGPVIGPTAGLRGDIMSRVKQITGSARQALARMAGGAKPLEEGAFYQTYDMGVAEALADDMIRKTPGREVGIWRNAATGEVIVVQGSGNFASGAVSNVPVRGGPWTFVEHFHPERNFAVPMPSTNDFMYLESLAKQGTAAVPARVSSKIRYLDPSSGKYHFTEYGIDPALKPPLGPYFVRAETKSGAMIELSATTMTEWQAHLANIAKKGPGTGTF